MSRRSDGVWQALAIVGGIVSAYMTIEQLKAMGRRRLPPPPDRQVILLEQIKELLEKKRAGNGEEMGNYDDFFI